MSEIDSDTGKKHYKMGIMVDTAAVIEEKDDSSFATSSSYTSDASNLSSDRKLKIATKKHKER